MVKVVGHVIRVGHARKIALMASVAIGRRAGVTCRMTGDARRRRMRTGKRKCRAVVIEIGGSPSGGRVTLRANVVEIRKYMVGVWNTLEVGLMTRPAIGRRAGIPDRMTIGADHRLVFSG